MIIGLCTSIGGSKGQGEPRPQTSNDFFCFAKKILVQIGQLLGLCRCNKGLSFRGTLDQGLYNESHGGCAPDPRIGSHSAITIVTLNSGLGCASLHVLFVMEKEIV